MKLRPLITIPKWSLKSRYSNSLLKRSPKAMLRSSSKRSVRCAKIIPDLRENLKCSDTISLICGRKDQELLSKRSQSLSKNLLSLPRIFMIKWKLKVLSLKSLDRKFTILKFRWLMELVRTFPSNQHIINNRLKASFQLQVGHQALQLVLIKLLHLRYLTKFKVVITSVLLMSF